MSTDTILNFTHITDENLVNAIQNHIQLEHAARDRRQRMEHELIRRMEARGARELAHPDIEVKLDIPSPQYDYSKLSQLGELVPPEILKTAFVPEHEETVTVKAKWDARVFRGWGKYGKEVQDVIESAKIPGGPPRLKIVTKVKTPK